MATTSNSLDHTATDDEIMLDNGADIKDMESAAIAWVIENCFSPDRDRTLPSGSGGDSNITTVPFFAIKVITDIVDGTRPTHEEFLENLHAASVSLHGALLKTIQYLEGKTIADL